MGKKKNQKRKKSAPGQVRYTERPNMAHNTDKFKNVQGIKQAAESVGPLEAIQGLFGQINKLRQESPIPGPTPEERDIAAKRLKAFVKAMQTPSETVLQHLQRIECEYTIEDYESFIAQNHGALLAVKR